MGGAITLLNKKNAIDNLDNYRPLTMINIIYKIWDTIMSTRLNPILNLLTAESQYAYNQKRSTIDVLSMVGNVMCNNETHQPVLFDFSKAFGNIARDITDETLRIRLTIQICEDNKDGE